MGFINQLTPAVSHPYAIHSSWGWKRWSLTHSVETLSPQPICLTSGLKKPQCSRERDSPLGIQNGLGLLPSHKFLFGWNIAHKSQLKFLHEFAESHHASVHRKWKSAYLKTKEPWKALTWFWSQDTLEVPSVFRHINYYITCWIFKTIWEMIFPLKLMEGPSIYSHFLFFQQRNLRRRASEDHRGVLDEMYGREESPTVGEGVSGAAPADLTMNSEKVKEHTGLNTNNLAGFI